MSTDAFAPVARSYPKGHCVPAHAHPWPQLLYAASGVMSVETDEGSWIVPPQRGVWLPPHCDHETRMLTPVELSSLYLADTMAWSQSCEVIEVGALLRELILAAQALDPRQTPMIARDRLVVQLIAEEVRRAPRGGSPVPMPVSQKLQALCRRIIDAPALDITLEEHAAAVGMTPRTAARRFQDELRMGFRQWRQLVHVAHSVALMAEGVPVKVVADRLGYTPSAFAAMVRRSTGQVPSLLAKGDEPNC